MTSIPPAFAGRNPNFLGFIIAIDTEFKGPHTLTVQAAARIAMDVIAVQVYRAAAVPPTACRL